MNFPFYFRILASSLSNFVTLATMDDYKILLYIVAAVIYFISKARKKKKAASVDMSRPGTENNPTPQGPTKSFEDLLKEITGDAESEGKAIEVAEEVPLIEKQKDPAEDRRLEGERRAFADDESRRVYEESIKRAEGFDIEFKPNEHFKEPRLFKDEDSKEEEYSFADEIRDGLSANEAKKAVIYAEILNRKY